MIAEASVSETQMADPTHNTAADDARLFVQFSMRAHYDEDQSNIEKRPIFRDREYIRIIVPGDKDNTIERPVRDGPQYSDKRRFSQQYYAFKNNLEQPTMGTPLEHWTEITPALLEELKFYQVRTVEQLAGMADAQAQNIRNSHELRRKAKAFIDLAKGLSEAAKLEEELKKRDAREAELLTKIEKRDELIMAMDERLKELEGALPKKKGKAQVLVEALPEGVQSDISALQRAAELPENKFQVE